MNEPLAELQQTIRAVWPCYSEACRKEVDELLTAGGTLSAYRSNPQVGAAPRKGSKVAEFEDLAAKYFGVKHCIATNSGTMALTATIKCMGLPPGSEIITSPFTFSATPAAIIMAGYRPRFADIDPTTFCLDPDSIRLNLTARTRALLVVDLFGYLPDYKEYAKFGLPIIQDNCQAAGAVRDGKHVFGEVACGSGNGMKNLPVGEGGWCLTDDDDIADLIRCYISHQENFGIPTVSGNGRMPELTAVLAKHGLVDLDPRNEHRRLLANRVAGSYSGGKGTLLVAPGHSKAEPACNAHVYYVVPAILDMGSRRDFVLRLAQYRIEVSEGYIAPPLHQYPAFWKYANRPLPVVEELSSRKLVIFSGLTPVATDDDANWLAHRIGEALS